jgi:hypothetical protein
MSHAATNWAIQQRGLRPAAKILLWHLADCHNPTMGCFPTQEYLAERCEISRASINRQLEELERAGLVRREQRIDQSSRRQLPTRYVLAFETEYAIPDVVPRVSDCDAGAVSQKSPSRVSKSAKAVSHSCETLTSKGTSKEPKDAGAPVFNRIWERFPRRPGSVQSSARRAFSEIDPSEWPLVEASAVAAAAAFAEECRARGEKPEERARFVPFLANWLSSGDWREVAPVAAASEPEFVVLTADDPVVREIERERRAPFYVGKSGKITVPKAEYERAISGLQEIAA